MNKGKLLQISPLNDEQIYIYIHSYKMVSTPLPLRIGTYRGQNRSASFWSYEQNSFIITKSN